MTTNERTLCTDKYYVFKFTYLERTTYETKSNIWCTAYLKMDYTSDEFKYMLVHDVKDATRYTTHYAMTEAIRDAERVVNTSTLYRCPVKYEVVKIVNTIKETTEL